MQVNAVGTRTPLFCNLFYDWPVNDSLGALSQTIMAYRAFEINLGRYDFGVHEPPASTAHPIY
jgi:hypothetical protein